MSSIAAIAPVGIGQPAGRRRWTLVAALLSLLLLGAWALRPTLRVDLAPEQIRSIADLPHTAPVPAPVFPYVVRGDDTSAPERSSLVVYENGTPLGPAHAQHDRIRDIGRGAYSHWNRTVLFSSSDNTDPRRNGRRYTVEARAELSSLVFWPGLVSIAAAVALTGLIDFGGLLGCLQLVLRTVFPIAAITSTIWAVAYVAYRQDSGRALQNFVAYRQDSGRVIQRRAVDSEVIYEQLRRAAESPPADLAFVGDSSCLFGIDPATLRQLFPGKSVENFCTTAWVGPAGYGIQIRQMLDRGTLPKKIVIYINPVQFERRPGWDIWVEAVRRAGNAVQTYVEPTPTAALDYVRNAWAEHILYRPLPGSNSLFYGGFEVLLWHMRSHHGYLANAEGMGFRSPEGMVEFYRSQAPDPTVSRSFATTAEFDESLEGLADSLANLDRKNVFLLVAPLRNPLRHEALVELEQKTQWIAAELGLSPNNVVKSPAYLPSYLFSDGLHPNRWGSVLVTRELAKYLPPF